LYDEIIEETLQETKDMIIDKIQKKLLLQTTTNTQQKLTIKPNVPTKKAPPIQNNISNPLYSNQELFNFLNLLEDMVPVSGANKDDVTKVHNQKYAGINCNKDSLQKNTINSNKYNQGLAIPTYCGK
jgi:hypothetical protein